MNLKTFLSLGLLIGSANTLAFDSKDTPILIPFCDDAVIRLSPVKPTCIERKDERIFDIPTLKIDRDDLQKILQGAESSGGRIAPDTQQARSMHMGRRFGFNTPFRYACKVRLLADGGKTLSWLSQTEVELSNLRPFTSITRQDWSHGLIEGNDIDGNVTAVALVEPQIALDNYDITFDLDEGSQKISLEVCQRKMEELEEKTIGVCSSTKGTIKTRRLRTNFSYKTTIVNDSMRYNQTLTLDVNCKRLH